jgi:tetratricopeptide (TPR) repeat protein
METITFYSYKGGVGRTLALANIAIYLALFGKNVCLLDFDLEAPGLHYKFPDVINPDDIKKGFVDYLNHFLENNDFPESLKDYSIEIVKQTKDNGSINLIPAGNISDGSYWRKVSSINWHDLFYSENSIGLALFLEIKERIEKEFKPDFLLIDSRTGVTEMSGVCTSILPDKVVILIANNKENINGVNQIIKGIQRTERIIDDNPVKIILALTRISIPNDEKEVRVERKILKEIINKLNIDNQYMIKEIPILHSNRDLEFSEFLSIRQKPKEKLLLNDYLKLFSRIIPYDDIKILQIQTSGEYDKILKMYEKSLKIFENLGDNAGIAKFLHNIGIIYLIKGEYALALEMFEKSLKINKKLKDMAGISKSLHNIGIIHQSKGEYALALEMFEKSLEIMKELGDKAGISSSLHMIGIIHQDQGEYALALEMFEKSLEIMKELGDKAGISSSIGQIGQILEEKEDYKGAMKNYQTALSIFTELKSPDQEIAKQLLSQLSFKIGEDRFNEYLAEITQEMGQ